MDLHFDKVNKQSLRSGRYVMFPNDDIPCENDYCLSKENSLFKDNEEVTDMTYVVLQVNNDRYDMYRDFNVYPSASQFHNIMNREHGIESYVKDLQLMAKDYHNVDMMMKSDKLINEYKENGKLSDQDKKLMKAYVRCYARQI